MIRLVFCLLVCPSPFSLSAQVLWPLATPLRLLLAAVLLTSAVAKAWDWSGTRQALSEFGVPPQHARRASHLLLGAEAAIALLLLWDPFTRLGAVLASVLFMLFSLGVVNVLRQGRRPDCHCFGQLHSAPVGPLVVVRNLALVAASLGVARFPVQPLNGTPPEALATVLGACCVSLAASHLALWQSVQRKQNPSLRPGQLIPHVDLLSQDGSQLPIHTVISKTKSTLLVFSSPSCSLCGPLLPEVLQWRTTLSDQLTVVLLDVESGSSDHAWIEGSYRIDKTVLQTLKVSGTPGAILLSSEGRVVLAKSAAGAEEIVATVRTALASTSQ